MRWSISNIILFGLWCTHTAIRMYVCVCVCGTSDVCMRVRFQCSVHLKNKDDKVAENDIVTTHDRKIHSTVHCNGVRCSYRVYLILSSSTPPSWFGTQSEWNNIILRRHEHWAHISIQHLASSIWHPASVYTRTAHTNIYIFIYIAFIGYRNGQYG